MINRHRGAQYFRNAVFGVEDSLVSTVGLLSGIAVVGTDVKTIILAGVVLIFVEAFSMGMGSFLSEQSAEEFEQGREVKMKFSALPALVMFVSYFIAGFIPLAPYLLFPTFVALPASIIAALATLFILGILSGRFSRTNPLKSAFRMLIFGGIAIGLGVIVGIWVNAAEN